MTLRILFTGEGSSDNGLVPHVQAVAAESGKQAVVTAPDLGRIPGLSGCHAVMDKLNAIRKLGDDYDLVIVHRDADNMPPADRYREVVEAVQAQWPGSPHVAVVPVRALEAWLLLDEAAIRRVAENPRGRMRLDLPRGRAAETVNNPKKILQEVLATASGVTGRRLKTFRDRFPRHRQKLLESLDPNGPVSDLPSWKAFMRDLRDALERVP